jgi:hypothetical protein
MRKITPNTAAPQPRLSNAAKCAAARRVAREARAEAEARFQPSGVIPTSYPHQIDSALSDDQIRRLLDTEMYVRDALQTHGFVTSGEFHGTRFRIEKIVCQTGVMPADLSELLSKSGVRALKLLGPVYGLANPDVALREGPGRNDETPTLDEAISIARVTPTSEILAMLRQMLAENDTIDDEKVCRAIKRRGHGGGRDHA